MLIPGRSRECNHVHPTQQGGSIDDGYECLQVSWQQCGCSDELGAGSSKEMSNISCVLS